ncbi:tRNA-guanine(15) transglycosylase-like protein [Pelagophyceae sp. CCMP2097]|nr:tRNA-guanine(15) transglycosylase-like protein [Pelagophyceae sp. CCMP2097]|mmetsp:Transcript_9798/g.32278  ORF Transcript_9798/g.32278 Transcript_9798/m.32278 type:complete len:552 (-) Transcript_9798:54-1709(-)
MRRALATGLLFNQLGRAFHFPQRAAAPRRLSSTMDEAKPAEAFVENIPAKDLKKMVRRLQHGGPSVDAAAVAAMEARFVARAAYEKALSTCKGAITVAKKSMQREATPELAAELEKLQAEYAALTGRAAYSKGAQRAEAKAKQPPQTLGMEPPPDASTFPAYVDRDYFRFEVIHESKISRARVGRIHTPHGIIDTPCFVPVGTNGALKAVDSFQAIEAGVQLQFCNTYHLLVHPGADVVEQAGGLHKFMLRDAPIITDSGGFQVFSLADSDDEEDGPELKSKRTKRKRDDDDDGEAKTQGQLLKVSENGTLFRSYLDGSQIDLTPESSVAAQKQFGADIIIPLDELPPYHVTRERLELSVQLSHRWMARSLRAHLGDPRKQAMYAVVHGGVDRELRLRSAEYLQSLPFDGFAVGGSLGKDKAEMVEMLTWLMPALPRDKPNHLLGIADPESCLAVVPLGVDTMDSCNPTRIARHGTLLTTAGNLRIKATVHRSDYGDIDPEVKTIPYTRAYLHHLFKQNEPLALTLASLHNILFMNHLMKDMREKIMRDEL